jgi:hypothetical protein
MPRARGRMNSTRSLVLSEVWDIEKKKSDERMAKYASEDANL